MSTLTDFELRASSNKLGYGRHPSMLETIARPFLRKMYPEKANEWTLWALRNGLGPQSLPLTSPALCQKVMGLLFKNPLGAAAGMDKNAEAVSGILGLGFSHYEVGTVTPFPQEGNEIPRVFRLEAEKAVLNRCGFNNQGFGAVHSRLRRYRNSDPNGIVGVNIGANKDSSDRAGDYVKGLETFYDLASYFTVNISSPNTPGLRDLQAPAALDELLGRVMEARSHRLNAGEPYRPIVVKIAPDIADDDIISIAARLTAHNVDAIAATNTTLTRPNVDQNPLSRQLGGLSGRPLFHRSTVMLARIYQAINGRIPLIGIGGIDSPERALQKMEAGASLLQIYSGLTYEGPSLINRINEHLDAACHARDLANISALVGSRAAEWAAKPLDG